MSDASKLYVKGSGNLSFSAAAQQARGFRPVKRPETPEEALLLMQAFYDAGVTFNAWGSKQIKALEANPMLTRDTPTDADPMDTGD